MIREIPTQFELNQAREVLSSDDRGMIAQYIRTRIQHHAPKDTGEGARSVQVKDGEDDELKIEMLDRMWYLNDGFKPFIMTGLIGRTVPIRLPNGVTIFRRVTAENVGARRITHRDPKTGQITEGNKPIAWRHPGVRPMQFVQKGIKDSLPFAGQMIVRSIMRDVMEQLSDEDDNASS